MKVTFNEIDVRVGDVYEAVQGDKEGLRKHIEQDSNEPIKLDGLVIDRVYSPAFGGGANIFFVRVFGEQSESIYLIFSSANDPKPKLHHDFEEARSDFTDRLIGDEE